MCLVQVEGAKMGRVMERLTYANVMSTLALCLALTGSAVAAGVPGMITSRRIVDNTIQSRDVKNGDLLAADLSVDARRLVTARTSRGPIAGYESLSPIVSKTLHYGGFYVVFTQFRAANTGSNDAYLNCGYRVNGMTAGAAGVQAAAGATENGLSVTVIHAPRAGQTVEFACENGGSTWDISGVRFTAFRLGTA
jgi:hypothetical protein